MANEQSQSTLNSSLWLSTFFAAAAMLIVGFCAISYCLDLFGVFRDTRGRSLSVYNNERTAKYLLNKHYVPDNFDGLLIGSSATANWELGELGGLHIYNNSLDGGNASEARLLVEQALPRGHFKVAICQIHPYMLHFHQLNEGGTGMPSFSRALLSVNILREELQYGSVHLLHAYQKFHPDGSKTLQTVPNLHLTFPVRLFQVDPVALDDYKVVISELHQRGIYVVLVISPLYQPVLDTNLKMFNEATQEAMAQIPHEAVIDFNSDNYRGFRSDGSNYDDPIHLNPNGARRISAMLASELRVHLPDTLQAPLKNDNVEVSQ